MLKNGFGEKKYLSCLSSLALFSCSFCQFLDATAKEILVISSLDAAGHSAKSDYGGCEAAVYEEHTVHRRLSKRSCLYHWNEAQKPCESERLLPS